MTKKVNLVVAVDSDHAIGSTETNSIPWHLPPDLKYFRELTLRKPIIMGKNTYLSLQKPLDGRLNIVVTRKPKDVFPFVNGELAFGYDQVPVIVCSTLDRAIHLGKCLSDEVMIVGGGQIYKEALENNIVDMIYMTTVCTNSGGNVFFPNLTPQQWDMVYNSQMQEHKGLKFYVSQFKRKEPL